MGREALCRCRWGAESADVQVLLEGSELIVRGAMKRRVSVADLEQLAAKGENLTFRAGSEEVALTLGAKAAERWALAIATPPPSLARKLGIAAATRIKVCGTVDDENLREALTVGQRVSAKPIHLVVARVNSLSELQAVFESCGTELDAGVPLWIVYPKGSGKELGEPLVRGALLERGLVDTKVSAVSARLTAIRCSLRKAGPGSEKITRASFAVPRAK